jgi:single-strand DNA-binding protein
MSGVNKVIIVGRLGTDPEVKTVTGGQQVARLSVATSENWTDKQGQKQERTEWHRVVVWGKLADLCGKYLSKGRQVYLEGRLQTRSWEDQQGVKKYTTEIVASTIQFLSGAAGANASVGGGGAGEHASSDSNSGFPQDFGSEPAFDASDDIPF